jgi:DNA polymerase-1
LIRAVLEQRELSKLQSTYVDALPALVNPQTGRIHTSFNQTGTTTGRLSSSNPNLQNIPARTARGREVRHAFIAPEGWLLLAADYSQIELRVLAQVSGDEGLRKAFREGQDIHRSTAAAVHGIAPEDVTYEQRSFAKSVNFGLMYGMGAYRLARDSDLTLKEAQDFIETYFKRFPNVRAYFEGTKRFLYEHKYVETLFGRRRYFEGVDFTGSSRSRADAERAAINMPIQGTAADILKLAMIELHRLLRARGLEARMILQVHDELVLEVPEDELAEAGVLVREVMEGVPALARRDMDPDFTFEVPLVVDAQVGRDWGSMEDWQNQEE